MRAIDAPPTRMSMVGAAVCKARGTEEGACEDGRGGRETAGGDYDRGRASVPGRATASHGSTITPPPPPRTSGSDNKRHSPMSRDALAAGAGRRRGLRGEERRRARGHPLPHTTSRSRSIPTPLWRSRCIAPGLPARVGGTGHVWASRQGQRLRAPESRLG